MKLSHQVYISAFSLSASRFLSMCLIIMRAALIGSGPKVNLSSKICSSYSVTYLVSSSEPSSQARRRSGLEVSPDCFLENHFVQGQIRDSSAQSNVLLLQLLESLHLSEPHPLSQRYYCLTELGDDFLRSIPLP